MDNKELSIEELRRQIDGVDSKLVELFTRRMEIAAQVALYKRGHGLQVADSARERDLLLRVSQQAGEGLADYTKVLYSTLFSLSRSYQEKLLAGESPLCKQILNAVEATDRLFPQSAAVACQGIEGAYSQMAAEKLFELPQIKYYSDFDSVFNAIDAGECRYGVLPLENSTAGSVAKIYDLMLSRSFYIVRSLRMKIDHNLLARPGIKLENIREVFSHEQAIHQCAAFLREHPQIKVTACANTAVAAKTAAQSERDDIAALSSKACAQLYGLCNLAPCVQDSANNYTRFICISRRLEIYPGADKSTVMAVAPNRPGALYTLLSRFFAHGINLTKLESRPLPDRDFEFMFYFDLDTPVYSEKLPSIVAELERQSEEFRYLGSYSEQLG